MDNGSSAITGVGGPEGPVGAPDGSGLLLPYGNGNAMDFYTSPGSSVADIASWIEFESMVGQLLTTPLQIRGATYST